MEESMTPNDINPDQFGDQFNTSPCDTNVEPQPIIKVIGVGGGGNNAVSHMYDQGIKNVSFVVLNTDRQALKNSNVPTKVEIGNGLGAGNKPEVARKAAEEDIAKIDAMFDDNTKMVFITAGMGGGTGTGASPVIARVAKEKGILTIGIVTIPFGFEGEKKILKAYGGADELAKYVDALLVINNQRLSEIYGDLNFLNAFGKADDTLSIAASSISELITVDGYMNVDFNDVDTTLRNGGAAIISCGYGEGENRVTKAIEDALNSPLLKNRDIFGSKKLLFHIFYSRKAENEFIMSEVDELTSFVNGISSDVDVIWGVGFDESLGEQVKITILAAGFDPSNTRDDNPIRPVQPISRPEPRQAAAPRQAAPAAAPQPAATAPDKTSEELLQRMKNDYGNAESKHFVVLKPEQMDNDEVIEAMERIPTAKRDKQMVDSLKANGASGLSVSHAVEQASRQNPGSTSINFME